ncbi:hypothetical protein NT6N_39970 [Oceaniferula spumae]|uniref:DUF2071 domain-containing protein n=1 Tax=Oceaniferula spumae TaxID=2979115 RepID=A0AAT9FSS3_9BACT
MTAFLNTHWTDLLVVNYRLDPTAIGLLEEHLPAGTELDTYHGDHYVSVVAFEFSKTRIMGIPMPFYRSFPEINLRFYVRRKVNGEWRRGVVFIKEIVPCKLPALIANKVFKENFHVRPLSCETTDKKLTYRWTENDEAQELQIDRLTELETPNPGSLTEHIIDHYWAYKKITPKVTGEFKVTHRPWKTRPCHNAHINLNLAKVYGKKWANALTPVSTFYANGSQVGVTNPKKLKT